ncbi:hypothetical protein ZWY2020_055631 [Hordeum vulgare]|nr:hypothetical protein ZWY2020_055631 [Hordeum vulgare]
MEDGDGEQPDQLLQSKGSTESKHDSKLGMENALLDKGSELLLESDSDITVDKRTVSEINADLSEAEMSDGLLCDGVINMLRKILDTKETREIVRQKTLKVRFLDFIDFGPIQLQATMPRICVWKGNLIKLFSETLMDKIGADGDCNVKNESETCYGQENHQWASTKRYSYLKAAIERTVGDTLNEKGFVFKLILI